MAANSRQGFPLSALFLLIAVIAVLLALLGSSMRRNTIGTIEKPTFFQPVPNTPPPDVDVRILTLAVLAGACTGAVIGTYTGWLCPSRLVGILLGLPVGTTLGGIIAALLVCPPDFLLTVGGCAIVLVTAGLTRLLAK